MNKLVSILVISYNSSEYILQTLESIKNQTYQNIELIISDDCSKDNTVTVAKEWLKENHSRFIRSEICASPVNEGVAKNLNKGAKLCGGYYIKIIAADDILDAQCIENNYNECEKHGYRVLYSKIKVFYGNDTDNMKDFDDKDRLKYFNYTAQEQNKVLSYKHFPNTVTFFVEKKLLADLDYFDERFKFMEDHPLEFKMTEKGIKLNFFDCTTVYYRIHPDSLCHSSDSKIVGNTNFYSSRRLFFYKVRLEKLLQNGYFYKVYSELIIYIYKDLVIFFGNKKNILTTSLKVILLLDPEKFAAEIKKINDKCKLNAN